MSIGSVDAAVRSTDAVNRNQTETTTGTVVARTASNTNTAKNSTARNTTTTTRDAVNINLKNSSTRSATQQNISRSATSNARNSSGTTTSRNATSETVARQTNTARNAVTQTTRSTQNTGRATTVNTVLTNTFGTDYNTCRDAYFTCMDQFCATANDTYRRCICSSRLTEIKDKERALSQSATQIQDFKDLNIDVIPKTAEEVNAMLNATEGELSITKDTSASAQQLAGINSILSSQVLNKL